MNYIFPENLTFDQVKAAIIGFDEFIVAEKDGYVVVNYVVSKPGTFSPISNEDESWKIRRECRGLIFTEDGTISRPFHKFFNIGEREETQAHILPWDMKFDVLEKCDGSMIRPVFFKDNFRLGTKMGITDIAMDAECFVARTAAVSLIEEFRELDCTPIFEYVGPNNRIVVEYDFEGLILTAVRDNQTGRYWPYSDMRRMGFPLCERYTTRENFENNESILKFLEDSKHDIIDEGFVIRWHDGHMVKSKTLWYVNLHSALDDIRFDHKIIQKHLNNNLDDVMAEISDRDQKRCIEVVSNFENAKEFFLKKLAQTAIEVMNKYGDDRKAFALGDALIMDAHQKTCTFQVMSGRTVNEYVDRMIRGKVNSQSNYELLMKEMNR